MCLFFILLTNSAAAISADRPGRCGSGDIRPLHDGLNQNETYPINSHELEGANERSGACEGRKPMNEWYERTDERVARYLAVLNHSGSS